MLPCYLAKNYLAMVNLLHSKTTLGAAIWETFCRGLQVIYMESFTPIAQVGPTPCHPL